MCKTPITRQQITAMVLAAIREHPGCQSVNEIAITPVEMLNVGNTWHVNIIDSGTSDQALAITAAREVQERLSPLFEVID